MPTHSAPFDWLSDHKPLFAAQELWDNGSYSDLQNCHLVFDAAGPFYIACGIGLLAEHVRRFRFSPEVIQRLGQITDGRGRSLLHESFLNHLQRLHLSVQIQAAPEGTVLLPGEPLLCMQGPAIQIALMESALRLLCWESTHWATEAALMRWDNKDWADDENIYLLPYPNNPEGWRKRALYIGGGNPATKSGHGHHVPAMPAIKEPVTDQSGEPLIQIRRLFKGTQPLADIWLTAAMEETASVSKTSITFRQAHQNAAQTMQFSRFQNLYQPALAKGHPVVAAPRPGYFRQRALKQMEAFYQAGLNGYPLGWRAV
jgi:hypothetical protein